MATRLPIRRIYFQDIIDEEGNVNAEKLLYPVNTFMESTYEALNGQLEFGINIKSQIKTLTFTTEADYVASSNFIPLTFINTLSSVVQGVVLLRIYKTDDASSIITNAVGIHWEPKQNDVKLAFVTGLADSTKYTIKLLVI